MYAQCLTTRAKLKASNVSFDATMTEDPFAGASIIEDHFATSPEIPAVSMNQAPGEEELHTSFEHAISGRLIAVNRRLRLISGPLTTSEQARLQTSGPPQPTHDVSIKAIHQPMSPTTTTVANTKWLETTWQRIILLVGLAFIFLLAGFDIMGLLVLHAH